MRPRHQAAPPVDTSAWFVVGTPAPASAPDVIWRDVSDTGAIQAADRFFDPVAFVGWSHSVYDRTVAAWRDKNPGLLRPVMAQAVWDRYAQFLLTVSVIAIGSKLMSSAAATATLAGTDAAGPNQSVTIAFAVSMTAAAASLVDPRHRTWQERWLFQRPAASRTHVSGSVAVCLVCGGPADPADSGSCPFCAADITTRTAGWLVTQVATTMPGVPKIGGAASGATSRAASGATSAARMAGTPLQPPRER